MIREATIRDPRESNPGLPKPLAALLLRALAKDPSARFATADELRQELESWLFGQHAPATHEDVGRLPRTSARVRSPSSANG